MPVMCPWNAGALGTIRRQFTGPVDLLTISQPHFRLLNFHSPPFCSRILMLYPMRRREAHLRATRTMTLPGLPQRTHWEKHQDPVIPDILGVSSMVHAIHRLNHPRAVLMGDLHCVIRGTMIDYDHFIAGTQGIQAPPQVRSFIKVWSIAENFVFGIT